jgi:Condensation domain
MSTERLAQLSPEKRALLLKLLKSKTGTRIRRVPRDSGHIPVSFGQHRLWFLEQMIPGKPFFNESMRFRLQFPLNFAALERTLNEIVRRHEALRTAFDVVGGEPVQIITPSLHLPLWLIDLRHLRGEARREREAVQLARDEAIKPFDLSKVPLVRTTLLRMGEADYIFLMTDGLSRSSRMSLRLSTRHIFKGRSHRCRNCLYSMRTMPSGSAGCCREQC